MPPISGTHDRGAHQPAIGCRSARARPGEAEGAQRGAEPVERAPRRRACRAPARRCAISTSVAMHERDVDREDPAPRDRVDELAAGERPDHGGDARPRRPRADRRAALARPGTSRRSPPARSGSAARRTTPCSARPATSSSMLGASAHSTETTPKPATPSENIRRSPKMSPSEPPTRISEPSVSRYALGPTAARRDRRRGRRGSPAARR